MNVKIEQIIAHVAEANGLLVADLKGPRRRRSIAWPRQMAMALCREMTDRSLPDIGMRFGGRDHTTVLHAVRRVGARRKSDPSYDKWFLSAKVAIALMAAAPAAHGWPVNVLTMTKAEMLMLGDFGTQILKMMFEPRLPPNTCAVPQVRPTRYVPRYLGSEMAASPVTRMMGKRA